MLRYGSNVRGGMDKQQVEKILRKAADMCSRSGVRFTEKRRRILRTLVDSNVPLSAYEVAAEYNKNSDEGMPAMSVYRILDFLESESLVHKLSSNKKYVACSHIACSHEHEQPQFLICYRCQAVKEIAFKRSTINDLRSQVEQSGFKMINSQLEFDCVCEKCSAELESENA